MSLEKKSSTFSSSSTTLDQPSSSSLVLGPGYGPLGHPVSVTRSDLKELLLVAWNIPPEKFPNDPSDALFEHYKWQIMRVELHGLRLYTNEQRISFICWLKCNVHRTKEDLVQQAELDHPDIGPAIQAISVAAHLWMFISIDNWDDKQTFEQYVGSLFQRFAVPDNTPQFHLSFNLHNLEKIGSFDVCLTSNLEDHLAMRVGYDHKELRVFKMISFLGLYIHTRDRPILPPEFFEETARTITLLDRWDYLKSAEGQPRFAIEPIRLPLGSRNPTTFSFWSRRLLELRDEYDRSEPTTLRQWLIDKRKPNQRYTFWIAVTALVFSLVFGLIQSVTGIIQAMH